MSHLLRKLPQGAHRNIIKAETQEDGGTCTRVGVVLTPDMLYLLLICQKQFRREVMQEGAWDGGQMRCA